MKTFSWNKHLTLPIFTALLCLQPLALARADLSWQSVITTVLKLGNREEKMAQVHQGYSLKENVLRIDDSDQGGVRFYNFQYGMAVFLNLNDKTFEIVPFNQIISDLAQEREEMKKELALRETQLPAMEQEERKIAAAQIAAQKKKYEVWTKPYSSAPTTEKTILLGHPCLKYRGGTGGEFFQEVWAATDLGLEPNYKNFLVSGLIRLDPQEYSYLFVPGFPMKVITRYESVTVTMEVTHLSTARLPLEAFLIPPDFRPARQTMVVPE